MKHLIFAAAVGILMMPEVATAQITASEKSQVFYECVHLAINKEASDLPSSYVESHSGGRAHLADKLFNRHLGHNNVEKDVMALAKSCEASSFHPKDKTILAGQEHLKAALRKQVDDTTAKYMADSPGDDRAKPAFNTWPPLKSTCSPGANAYIRHAFNELRPHLYDNVLYVRLVGEDTGSCYRSLSASPYVFEAYIRVKQQLPSGYWFPNIYVIKLTHYSGSKRIIISLKQ